MKVTQLNKSVINYKLFRSSRYWTTIRICRIWRSKRASSDRPGEIPYLRDTVALGYGSERYGSRMGYCSLICKLQYHQKANVLYNQVHMGNPRSHGHLWSSVNCAPISECLLAVSVRLLVSRSIKRPCLRVCSKRPRRLLVIFLV